MSELKGALREAADRHRPPADWLERIHDRARRKRRNQRIAAVVVAFAVFLAVAAVLVRQLAMQTHRVPADRSSVAPARACGPGTRIQPTGWWTADDTHADAGGKHDAVFHGDVRFAPGLIGDAFTLDGEGDWIEVADDPAFRVGSEDFTISFWVRFDSTRGEQVLAEAWVETFEVATQHGWTLTKLADQSIGFGTGPGGGATTERLDLPTRTWIHITARRRSGKLSVFVNGQVAAVGKMAEPMRSLDSAATLKFGHRGAPEDTPGSEDTRGFYLHGRIDEIELFVGRGLSDATIRRIFQRQSGCAM